MDERKIYLSGREFNSWMELMGQEITKVKDSLVLLETEERQLLEMWESGAKEVWEQEMQKKLENIRSCVADMELLAAKAESRAGALARIEKIMIQEAGGL